MFHIQKKALVYRSKDEADWEKAKKILNDNQVENKAWANTEPPVGGCGSKIDVRTFMNGGKKISKIIYFIEVNPEDKDKAESLLKGNVQPVRSYGSAF